MRKLNAIAPVLLAVAIVGAVAYIGVNLLGASRAASSEVVVPALPPGVAVPTTGAYWGGNNGTVQADPNIQAGCGGNAYALFECKVSSAATGQGITLPKQSDGKYHASMEHLYMQCDSAESKLGENGYAWNEAKVPGRKVLFINFKCGNWGDLTGNSAADARVKRIAGLLANLPVPVIVSYDAEPEDNSCDPPSGHGSSGTPDDFRAGFRQFVADMRQQEIAMGKNRISFAFVMMGETYRINSTHVFNGSCAGEVRNSATGSMRNAENWWPGDDVVDWIGTDPYDFGGTITFDTLMNWTYSFANRDCPAAHPTSNYNCTAERKSLPIISSEYATCAEAAAYRGTWFDNHKAKLRSYPRVKAYAYWSEAYDYPCWVDYPFNDASKTSLKAFARLSSDSWLTTPTFDAGGADTTKPTVAITSPVAGETITIGTKTDIKATADDNVGVDRVEFYIDGSLKQSDDSTPYVYNWDTGQASAGAHSLTAKAYDAAGNTKTSDAISVTLVVTPPSDQTPPTVSITAPTNGSTVWGKIKITGTASDAVGVTSVTLRVDDTFVAADDNAPYSFDLDTTAYTNGTHTIVLRAFDAADNMGQSQPVTITVNTNKTNGDANKDGRVNALDLSMLISHDGQDYQPTDFNNDHSVDGADQAILLGHWTW